MHPLFDKLFPRNKSQKIGLFVAIALSIGVVFLHNPLDGYDTFVTWSTPWGNGYKDLPFLEWQSTRPIIDWFGALTHLGAAIASIWILCATWLYLFRDQTERGQSD